MKSFCGLLFDRVQEHSTGNNLKGVRNIKRMETTNFVYQANSEKKSLNEIKSLKSCSHIKREGQIYINLKITKLIHT